MRLVIAAALALAAAPAAAQPTVALAPGEVLLEIDARGRSVTRADIARVSVPVLGRGATPAAARADNDAKAQRLIAAARSAGIAAADISHGPPAPGLSFVGNEAFEHAARIGFISEPPEGAPRMVPVEHTAVQIRLRDPAVFPRLRELLEAAGADSVPDPVFRLGDPAAARHAAKADAIRNARSEAAAYARGAGLRIDRLVRISEREVSDMARMNAMPDIARIFGGEGSSTNQDVEVSVWVALDFVLAPER